MADGICDICGIRPATVRTTVTVDGRREVLELCDLDYRRLARQQRSSSPLESLFGGRGGSLLDDFFGDRLGEEREDGSGAGGGGTPIPVRSAGGRRRGGPDLAERLSEHAQELLQRAARTAVEFGRREVDTEHLLLRAARERRGQDGPRPVQGLAGRSPDPARAGGAAAATARPRARPRSASRRGSRTRSGAPSRPRASSATATSARSTCWSASPRRTRASRATCCAATASPRRRSGSRSSRWWARGAEEGRVERPTNTPNLDKYARDLTALARRGQARPGDRPRQGDRDHDRGPGPAQEEQPGADRRAGRRQDRHRRGPGAAHRRRRGAGGAARQAPGRARASTRSWRARSTAASSRSACSRSSRRSRTARTS